MHVHEILAVIRAEIGDPLFRYNLLTELRTELRKSGIWHIDRQAILAQRASVAAKLIGEGMKRPEVRQALQERFGVSRRTAYNLIDRALNDRRPRVAVAPFVQPQPELF